MEILFFFLTFDRFSSPTSTQLAIKNCWCHDCLSLLEWHKRQRYFYTSTFSFQFVALDNQYCFESVLWQLIEGRVNRNESLYTLLIMSKGFVILPTSATMAKNMEGINLSSRLYWEVGQTTTTCKISGDTSPSWGVINLPITSHTAAPFLINVASNTKIAENFNSQLWKGERKNHVVDC